MDDLKNEIDNIKGHIKMLIDEDVLEKIGADKGDNRPLHIRVLRILEAYNNLQAENKRLKEALEKMKDSWCYKTEGNCPDIARQALRVLRILEAYNNLQAENKRLKELWERVGKIIAYLMTDDETIDVAGDLQELREQALKETK